MRQYEQVAGLEKRLKNDTFDKSMAEIDTYPVNSKSFEIQNILFNFCGIKRRGQHQDEHKKSRDALFGNIKRLPQKSFLL